MSSVCKRMCNADAEASASPENPRDLEYGCFQLVHVHERVVRDSDVEGAIREGEARGVGEDIPPTRICVLGCANQRR